MEITVLGSGAMGSLYGGLLAAAGEAVTLYDVREDHVAAIRADGLAIAGPAVDGETVVRPAAATTDPGDLAPADLALVFAKSTHTEAAVRDGAGALGPDTTVLTLQNGLGNPEAIARVLPSARLVAGTSTFGAEVVAPGRVRNTVVGASRFGRFDGPNGPVVGVIADAFEAAGLAPEVVTEPRRAIWEKALVNVGANPVAALARVPNGVIADAEAGRRLVRRLVEEGLAVARAEGHDLDGDAADDVLALLERARDARPSMLQDVEAGRRTEIEAMNGEIVRRGEAAGVPVPANRTIANLVRLADAGNA